MYYRKKRTSSRPINTNREKVIAGRYAIGDTVAGRIITGFGKQWFEGGFNYQYAYFGDNQGSRVYATTFSSGETVYQNSRGRCEDAPCCGCCS